MPGSGRDVKGFDTVIHYMDGHQEASYCPAGHSLETQSRTHNRLMLLPTTHNWFEDGCINPTPLQLLCNQPQPAPSKMHSPFTGQKGS